MKHFFIFSIFLTLSFNAFADVYSCMLRSSDDYRISYEEAGSPRTALVSFDGYLCSGGLTSSGNTVRITRDATGADQVLAESFSGGADASTAQIIGTEVSCMCSLQ